MWVRTCKLLKNVVEKGNHHLFTWAKASRRKEYWFNKNLKANVKVTKA
jgi:hypothetical protein